MLHPATIRRFVMLGTLLLALVELAACVPKYRPDGDTQATTKRARTRTSADRTETILEKARGIVAESQGAWLLTNALHEAALLAGRNLMMRPRDLTSSDIPLDALRDAAMECIDDAPLMGPMPLGRDQLLKASRNIGQRTGLVDLPVSRNMLARVLETTETCAASVTGRLVLGQEEMSSAGRAFSQQLLDHAHEVRIYMEVTPTAWETLQQRILQDTSRLTALHPALDQARKQGASRRKVAAAHDALNALLSNEMTRLKQQTQDQRDLSESDLIEMDSRLQEFLEEDPFLGLY